ncbi:MAG TPA: UDP-N-acetylmuramoyl-L-alanine--D-glutamate ligase [Acidimicrobiales bacterium]|nr:UDP-N-acetylmuramoyl-L-alanine--D-glutamate ligase [Acidimicrobiales bacterium]
MRYPLSWTDLRGRTVGVWGLGMEGRANVDKLRALDVEPVVVADERDLAAGGLASLMECEVVVKSPGISRYRAEARALVEHGVALVGGLGLWLQSAPFNRVVVITGTKGKSTTTAVLGHLLERLGHRCFIGGNIGRVPYAADVDESHYDYWALEVSSYQATDLTVSPRVVAVTSLHPDHLPWHGGTVENYYRDKLSVCTQPGAEWTVANAASETLRTHAELLGPRIRWVPDDRSPSLDWAGELGLIGEHNRVNAEIARAAIELLGVDAANDPAALRDAARGFVPLPSRLTRIGTVRGVEFVDDSLSTNVLPTLAAVDSFSGRRIALIVGGEDRGIDYEPLAAGLARRADPLLVLTVPDSGARIAKILGARSIAVHECGDLTDAVRQGFVWTQPDGVVLLSPAAPSFGRFHDYRDRGDAFAAAMRACENR